MALGQAWLSISISAIIGAIESVRNRIMAIALEAEALEGNNGIDSPNASGNYLRSSMLLCMEMLAT
jgi:hypothetical protein